MVFICVDVEVSHIREYLLTDSTVNLRKLMRFWIPVVRLVNTVHRYYMSLQVAMCWKHIVTYVAFIRAVLCMTVVYLVAGSTSVFMYIACVDL